MKDPFDLFKNCDYGIYKVKCIRHYEPNEFPRWKVTKVFDAVPSNSNKQISSERSNASVKLQQTCIKEFSSEYGQQVIYGHLRVILFADIASNEQRKDSGVGSEKSYDVSRKSSESYTKSPRDDECGNNDPINEDLQSEVILLLECKSFDGVICQI
ncbi:unnamed protein product [Cylicostephanus goldi]|uniref:Uncharacterized protein n=1 Tax=Cylicostephanus goldi TaxID=71465 RepID=A0A3P6SFM6_CYLGO|nr:unnamed protein product [Cylicostephanus goldi]